MNGDAYPKRHAMGFYRCTSLYSFGRYKLSETWSPNNSLIINIIRWTVVKKRKQDGLTWPSDPPLPPNRTLCCSHSPASPPMHTTSFTCTTKVPTNHKPTPNQWPWFLHLYSLLACTSNNSTLTSKFKYQCLRTGLTILCPTTTPYRHDTPWIFFPGTNRENLPTILRGFLLHALKDCFHTSQSLGPTLFNQFLNKTPLITSIS